MIRALAITLSLAAASVEAQEATVPTYEELDRNAQNAVYDLQRCVEFHYRNKAQYLDCLDLPFVQCEKDRKKGFGAQSCSQHMRDAWMWMIGDIQRGSSNGVEDAHLFAPWQAWADEQCKVTTAVVLPWSDVPADQQVRCKAELAGLQAIRMWVSRAP